MIENIKNSEEKKIIARTVLEGLREWFEVEESREGYIRDCADWTFLAAKDGAINIFVSFEGITAALSTNA